MLGEGAMGGNEKPLAEELPLPLLLLLTPVLLLVLLALLIDVEGLDPLLLLPGELGLVTMDGGLMVVDF